MSRLLFVLMCLLFFSIGNIAQTLGNGSSSTGTPWPGSGVMVSGELWDSFLPPNAGPYYSETGRPLVSTFLRMGNFDRVWSTPTHMWPGGWPLGMFWGKGMYLTEFNPDTTWNPAVIAGSPNPACHPQAGPRYAFASFASGVLGGSDPARNYGRETRWNDPPARRHAVYEAAWPTNIGIDVKVTIHQFTLNWNNFDDFIIVEIALTNTGVLDMNADGIADSLQTGRPGRNRIRALTMMAHGEIFGMYMLNRAGARSSRLGSTRGFGYVGDTDRTGRPGDMMVAFAGESVPWLRDMGLNDWPDRYYTDVWSAWAWLAAKKGAMPSDQLHTLPDKETIFGTHGIGTGTQRGWYATAGQGRGLGVGAGGYGIMNPGRVHTTAMGAWYRDGGKSRDSLLLDLSPDPNFFAAGIAGDPTTFVPAPSPSRPEGDRKLSQQYEVNAYEPGWKKGFSAANNFDGDMYSGIGPFSLEPGESMTIVWAEAGGYRFAGVANAIASARWSLDHGYSLPEQPPAPGIRVENTVRKSLRIRWDSRAESTPGFDGYKIYRVSSVTPVDWLRGGMRTLDRYWESQGAGPVPDSLMRPINPEFGAFDFVQGRTGAADPWGPYQPVAVIPRDALAAYASPGPSGLTYAWEDSGINPGFAYWYYVAASAKTTVDLGPDFGGTNPATASRLESSNTNRNGAEGLWQGVYPFADLHSNFPSTPDGRRALGAGFMFWSGTSTRGDLASGGVRVGVRPNPYKKRALWDDRGRWSEHRLMFYNLPPRATVTILDVSGQVIDQIHFVSPDGETGSFLWDGYSAFGIDVVSGLYIFVVEYEGGRQTGYFSILR